MGAAGVQVRVIGQQATFSERSSRVLFGDVAESSSDRGHIHPVWRYGMSPCWSARNRNSAPDSRRIAAREVWDQCVAADHAGEGPIGRCAVVGVARRLPRPGWRLRVGRVARERNCIPKDAPHCLIPSPSSWLLCSLLNTDRARGDCRSATRQGSRGLKVGASRTLCGTVNRPLNVEGVDQRGV